jgi:hypothetical protein
MKIFHLSFLVFMILLSNTHLHSQDAKTEKKLKRKYKFSQIIWDKYNEDGVFKARKKKSGKWGMYQYYAGLRRPKMVIPPYYDSLGFYDNSSAYTLCKQRGKYGTVGNGFAQKGPGKLLIRTVHDSLAYTYGHSLILASKRNGKWGLIHAETGDTIAPYFYDTKKELPEASPHLIHHPMKKYPEKLVKILEHPDTVTLIKLYNMELSHLPKAIGKCENLKVAILEYNNLKYLPKDFFELKKLKKLYLGSNASFVNFGEEFSKLENLEVLSIGETFQSVRTKYSSNLYLKLDSSLAKLKKLKRFYVFGRIYNNDPVRIAQKLPSLEVLSLKTPQLSPYLNGFDMSKMACKRTLRRLTLNTLFDISTLNENVKDFPSLEHIEIQTKEVTDIPVFLKDMQQIKYASIVDFKPDEGRRYVGSRVISISNYYGYDKPLSQEEYAEAIKEWKEYLNE